MKQDNRQLKQKLAERKLQIDLVFKDESLGRIQTTSTDNSMFRMLAAIHGCNMERKRCRYTRMVGSASLGLEM